MATRRRRTRRAQWTRRIAVAAIVGLATPAAAGPLEDGRAHFFAGEFVAADQDFALALATEPTTDDETAHAFRSITRIAAAIDANTPGPNPAELDSLAEILDAFGFAAEKRSILDFRDWSELPPRDAEGHLALPSDSPTGGVVQRFLRDIPIDRVDASLADLAAMSPDVAIVVTGAEQTSLIEAFGMKPENAAADLTVARAELDLWRAGLYSLRAALLLASAWNLDLDLDEVTNRSFRLHLQDYLDDHPDLLYAQPQGLIDVAQAGADVVAGIDAYGDASLSLRTRPACSPDCLIRIADEDLPKEADLRTDLANVRSSITTCTALSTDALWIGTAQLDLCGIFGGVSRQPIQWRAELPPFSYDPEKDPKNFASACDLGDAHGLFRYDRFAPMEIFRGGLIRPCGDRIEDAVAVGDGVVEGTFVGATSSGVPIPYTSFVRPPSDIWYRYAPTATGTIEVHACGQDMRALTVSVYGGLPPSEQTLLDTQIDTPTHTGTPGDCYAYSLLYPETAIPVTAGQTIWIAVQRTDAPLGYGRHFDPGRFFLQLVPEPSAAGLGIAAVAMLAIRARRRHA